MTTPTLIELRKLAEAATPGAWAVFSEPVLSPFHAAMELSRLPHGTPEFQNTLAMVVDDRNLVTSVTGCGKYSEANAAYIAAANPAKVIELLDALEAQAAEIERLKKLVVWNQEQREIDLAIGEKERNALRAELAALKAQEPVGYVAAGFITLGEGRIKETSDESYKVPVYLHASPVAQEVGGLVEDAERLDWIERKLFTQKWNGVVGAGCATQWSIAPDYRHTVQYIKTDDIEIDFRAAIDAAIAQQKGER
jgi:hypothetical protein